MNNINQCYEILRIKSGASLEEVKQAYRDLAFVWHPDRFPANNLRLQEKAQEELKKINAAYEVLKSHQVSCSANTKPPRAVDTKTHYEQGVEKAKRGIYKEAIEDFSYEIRLNPYYAAAYKYRGIAYSKIGDKQKAFYDFKQAIDLYLKQGKIDEYQDLLEQIRRLQIPEPDIKVETNYRKLHELILAGKWKQADRETFAVMLKVAGREKEGWLREEDLKNFPSEDLCTIDTLWVKYSKGRFGFSVQKQIWQSIVDTKNTNYSNWCIFGNKVGWRVNNFWVLYDRFIFTLDAPVGHLPLLTFSLNGVVQWGSWGGLFLFSRPDL